MIDYAMKYVKLLQSYCANIIMVFDGRSLPAKKETEAKRRENREKAKLKAAELTKNGRHDEARKEFSKAVVICHEYALELMEECRRYNVDCIVAMYEADAQLAYLNKIGLAEYIISEDSDLILFGCKKIVYKLTLDGKCTLFDSDKLDQLFPKFSFEKFRQICILSGCDYVTNLPGIGLAKAKKFILMTAETDMKKAIPKIPSYMNLKIAIPDDYIENFLKAEATFKYMYVYDPIKRLMTRLNELTDKEDEQYCVNAGELLKSELAYQIALGNINPKTMQKVSDYDPQKTLPRSLKRPPIQNTKYKPLFHIWDYNGHQEPVNKVRQQSKITFMPIKLKSSSNSEVSKIAEEENKIDDQIEMDSLISAYCGTEIATPSKTSKKRTSSVFNDDLNASVTSSPNNPFAKRQSLENKEKSDNVSLIKALSSKDTVVSSFEASRVVSRFFSNKSIQELEDPKEIIERIETAKIKREHEIQERLEINRQFYNTFKKVPKENCVDDEDDCTSSRNPFNKIKEKYGNQSKLISKTTSIDSINSDDDKKSTQEEYTHDAQTLNVELEFFENDDEISNSSQNTASQNNRLKATNRTNTKASATRKMKTKSTSITLNSQHKLSKFGFTTSNKNVM